MKLEPVAASPQASHDRVQNIGQIFLVGFAANVLARGQALFGALYSVDGYFFARMNYDDQVAYNLRDGRILRALLWKLQEALGFSPLASESASLVLATGTIVAAAMLFADALFAVRRRVEVISFVLLFTLHPFLTEYFYYGEVSFGIALSVLFAAVSVWLVAHGRVSFVASIASSAAVFAALATYQVAIGFILSGFLIETAREARNGHGILCRASLHRAAALVAGCATYSLSLLVLRVLRPAVAGGRAFGEGGASLGERLHALGQATLSALVPNPGILATPVAASSIFLAACGLLAIGTGAWRRRGPLTAVAVGALAALALVVACIPSVLSPTPWLATRLLSPSALVFAALAVSSLPAGQSWRRHVWMACSGVLLLGYFAADASILFDQRRVNVWDQRLASRIVARLEGQSGFPGVSRLAIVGNLSAHPFPLATFDHDLNASAFSAPWSRIGVIEQATGLAFGRASNAEMESANAYCAEHDPWPGISAVAVLSQLGVVCLSRP